MSCDFKNFCSSIICTEKYAHFEGTYKLKDCIFNTDSHLNSLGIKINLVIKKDGYNPNKKELILMRCGILNNEINNFSEMVICASHRHLLGIGFRPKKGCSYEKHIEISKCNTNYRNLTFQSAKSLLEISKNNI